jgi:hypothetical protein
MDKPMMNCVSQLREEWRVARAAHAELLLMGMPRVNLLVTGADGVIETVLESLTSDLREPVGRWRPGEQLLLPPPSLIKTMILRDVDGLSHEDQQQLLEWLDEAAGHTQIVSTSSRHLFECVYNGAFDETLFYRLNVVCVDATA